MESVWSTVLSAYTGSGHTGFLLITESSGISARIYIALLESLVIMESIIFWIFFAVVRCITRGIFGEVANRSSRNRGKLDPLFLLVRY
jgi:hypothetical protein